MPFYTDALCFSLPIIVTFFNFLNKKSYLVSDVPDPIPVQQFLTKSSLDEALFYTSQFHARTTFLRRGLVSRYSRKSRMITFHQVDQIFSDLFFYQL